MGALIACFARMHGLPSPFGALTVSARDRGNRVTTEREDELIRKIGGWGISDAPDGWRRIDMLFEIAYDMGIDVGYHQRLAIIVDDTNKLEGEPAPEVTPLVQELGRLMGRSWTAFRMVIESSGDYRAFFDYGPGPDTSPEQRIADELIFRLPPGWESARVRSDSATVTSITGFTYAWTPPAGHVPDGDEVLMTYPRVWEYRSAGDGAEVGEPAQ
jgi:hypothetical protein